MTLCPILGLQQGKMQWDEEFSVVIAQSCPTVDHPEGMVVRTCSTCDPCHATFMKHIAASDVLNTAPSSDVCCFFTPDFDCRHVRCAWRALIEAAHAQPDHPPLYDYAAEVKYVEDAMKKRADSPWPSSFSPCTRLFLSRVGASSYATW